VNAQSASSDAVALPVVGPGRDRQRRLVRLWILRWVLSRDGPTSFKDGAMTSWKSWYFLRLLAT